MKVPSCVEDSRSPNIEYLTCYILGPIPVARDTVANGIDGSTFMKIITGERIS